MGSVTVIDPNMPHYVKQVTNMPPTEIVCKCGAIFTGPRCIDLVTAHVHAENPPDEAWQ